MYKGLVNCQVHLKHEKLACLYTTYVHAITQLLLTAEQQGYSYFWNVATCLQYKNWPQKSTELAWCYRCAKRVLLTRWWRGIFSKICVFLYYILFTLYLKFAFLDHNQAIDSS